MSYILIADIGSGPDKNLYTYDDETDQFVLSWKNEHFSAGGYSVTPDGKFLTYEVFF